MGIHAHELQGLPAWLLWEPSFWAIRMTKPAQALPENPNRAKVALQQSICKLLNNCKHQPERFLEPANDRKRCRSMRKTAVITRRFALADSSID